MATAKNKFFIKRTARASVVLATVAATHASGVMIPKGAIVTGVKVVAPSTVVLTNASGTYQLAVGAVNICATYNQSQLGAQTVPLILPLATTNGNYITVDSEISVIQGTTNTSTGSGTYDFYIDYLFAA